MAVEVVGTDMDTDTEQLKLLSSSTVVVVADTDTAVTMGQPTEAPFHHHFWQRLLVVSTARTARTAHMDIHTVDTDTDTDTVDLIRQQSFLQLLVVCKSIHWNNKQMKNEEKQNENSNLNAKLCPIANTNLQLKFA